MHLCVRGDVGAQGRGEQLCEQVRARRWLWYRLFKHSLVHLLSLVLLQAETVSSQEEDQADTREAQPHGGTLRGCGSFHYRPQDVDEASIVAIVSNGFALNLNDEKVGKMQNKTN